jgi:hypothetical protein
MKIFNRNVTLHSHFSLVKSLVVVLVIFIVFGGFLYWYDPYERARQSRDEIRIQKLQELDKAIQVYLENNDKTKAPTCYGCGLGKDIFSTAPLDLKDTLKVKDSTSQAVNITGWVPIDFSLNARIGETPIKILPLDPLNESPYVYTYTPGKNGTYKLSTALESGQNNGIEIDDAGINDTRYELGNDLQLSP